MAREGVKSKYVGVCMCFWISTSFKFHKIIDDIQSDLVEMWGFCKNQQISGHLMWCLFLFQFSHFSSITVNNSKLLEPTLCFHTPHTSTSHHRLRISSNKQFRRNCTAYQRHKYIPAPDPRSTPPVIRCNFSNNPARIHHFRLNIAGKIWQVLILFRIIHAKSPESEAESREDNRARKGIGLAYSAGRK